MFSLNDIIKTALAEIKKDFKGTEEEYNLLITGKSKEFHAIAAKVFTAGLLKFYDKHRIKEIEANLSEFNEWNRDTYKDGLELMLVFIDLSVTVNKDMTGYFKVDSFPVDEKLKFMQLLHLHTKACHIMNEIYALVTSGYADAALARWRTLHETCVVFGCLFQSDTETSKMFHEFQYIDKYKRATAFQVHHETFNWKSIDANDLTVLKEKRDNLILLYGKVFGKDYGWAKNIVTDGNLSFVNLEGLIGLSYLRPFYKWANASVHAGAEGTFTRLSFDEVLATPRGILAGPSRYGMVDPIQFTTHSLNIMTSALVGLVKAPEPKLLYHLLEFLHNEIASSMIESKNKLPLPKKRTISSGKSETSMDK